MICAKDGERFGMCHCKGFKFCKCGISFNFRENDTAACEKCLMKDEYNEKITQDLKATIANHLPI